MNRIKSLYIDCNLTKTSFLSVLLRMSFYKILYNKNLLSCKKTIIYGIKNITINKYLKIGISPVGFTHKKDTTLLNIQGRLIIDGSFSIGRGCRFDIGSKGKVHLGNNSYINPLSLVIIMHDLFIGENCAISWNCQILDEDFHSINYEGKEMHTNNKIVISDNVWIGSNVSIYKGTFIAKGCVVAGSSSIKGEFLEENCLIAGNPARIVKRNIFWS